jgi:hypothetical protein
MAAPTTAHMAANSFWRDYFRTSGTPINNKYREDLIHPQNLV